MHKMYIYSYIADGIFATVYLLGTLAMLLSGLLLDKLGPPMVHGISLVLTVSAHAVLWQLPKYSHFAGLEYVLYVSALLGGKISVNLLGTTCRSCTHFSSI